MKIVLRTFFLAAICVVGSIIYGYFGNTGHAFSSGSPGGRSGSPGHNNLTCTSCHSGTATPTTDAITSNIPANGYTPGETYTFSVGFSEGSKTKYGFEARHEGADRKAKGTLIITESGRTRQVSSGQNASITHTSGGAFGSGNSNSWTWDWVAPASGEGAITVYAAINATNSSGSDSGDRIYTTSETFQEAITSVNAMDETIEVRAFPNPVTDYLNIEGDFQSVELLDMSGRVVVAKTNESSLSVGHLPKGIYFAKIFTTETDEVVQRVVKR